MHFCNDRASKIAPFSLETLAADNFLDEYEETAGSNFDMVQQYDPAFLLRFSIHSISMGYIEPIEFSRLGLLAITLVSISSMDDEVRKLGYESLGKYKKALENCRSSKDLLPLHLLLV